LKNVSYGRNLMNGRQSKEFVQQKSLGSDK
jgi:hypothetical protein